MVHGQKKELPGHCCSQVSAALLLQMWEPSNKSGIPPPKEEEDFAVFCPVESLTEGIKLQPASSLTCLCQWLIWRLGQDPRLFQALDHGYLDYCRKHKRVDPSLELRPQAQQANKNIFLGGG